MKKKLLTVVLVAAMALSMTACGGAKEDDAPEAPAVEEASEAGTEEAEVPEEAPAEEEPAEEEPAEEEAGMTLDEWMQSDEARQSEDMTNSSLEGTGMSVKLKADGNVFVYEYTMPDEYGELSEADMEAAMAPTIESYASGIADVYDVFDSEYGIKLDGVRFTFVLSDGTEIYSKEVTN